MKRRDPLDRRYMLDTVLSCIPSDRAISFGQLVEQTGFSKNLTTACLRELVLEGKVKKLLGEDYIRLKPT